MKILNTVKEFDQERFVRAKSAYIKEANIYICLNDCCLRIIKLENALKTGKTCDEIVVMPESYSDSFEHAIMDYMSNNDISLESIINNCLVSDFESLQQHDFNIEIRLERKGVETFSPFADVKPLKKMPAKWNKTNIVKAILTGQIFKGIKKATYTDDYAYDGAINYGKGRSLDLLELSESIINNGSDGWRFNIDKEENGVIEISASHYSFDYNTLYFDINCDSIEKAQAIVNNEDQERENNNKSLEDKCITIEVDSLDKNAVYEVEYLEMEENTKQYKTITKTVNYHGLVNEEYNEVWSRFWHTLSIDKININNTDMFIIADLRDYDIETIMTDERYIVSKLNVLLSGKGLIEYSTNGYSCSNIRKVDIQNLLDDMIKEQNGTFFSMFPSDKELEVKKINMLSRFNDELRRSSNDKPTPPEDKQSIPKEQLKENKINNNVIMVDFKNNKSIKAELQGMATSRQLYALHCITKVNTTTLNISKQTASELIKKSKDGINITEEVKALLNSNLANVK